MRGNPVLLVRQNADGEPDARCLKGFNELSKANITR
jgi:hypothetical protein